MSSDANPHALAPGTRILDYTIGSVIGTGGFSIVYKAMDEALGRTVAIKEYFPAAFAQRGRDGTVQPVSREKDTFSTGIVSFTNEGKLLAQFDKGSNITLLVRRGEMQTFITIKGLNGGN